MSGASPDLFSTAERPQESLASVLACDQATLEQHWLAGLLGQSETPEWLSPSPFGEALEQAKQRCLRRLWYNLCLEEIAGTEPWYWFDVVESVDNFPVPARFQDPIELLAWSAKASAVVDQGAWREFAKRVVNHYLNDALGLVYRRHSSASEKAVPAAEPAKSNSFLDLLARLAGDGGEVLFLEQWGAMGHPVHPLAKARIGMSPDEVLAYAPVFGVRIPIAVLALRHDRAHVESSGGIDCYRDWFKGEFASAYDRWCQAVRDSGHDPDDYLPVPCHPWQLEHRIRSEFAAALGDGDLLILDQVSMDCSPYTALRTMCPSGQLSSPEVKLPIDVWVTSVPRTISTRTCEMSPRISAALQTVFRSDTGVARHLSLQPEVCSVHYLDRDAPELEKQLNVVFRQASEAYRPFGHRLIPCASLCAPSPYDGQPLLAALLARGHGEVNADTGAAFFKAYAQRLVPGLLRLYLVYGVALEAHQQNTLLMADADWRISGFLLRDLGGVRIHRPTLAQQGITLQLHPDRLTICEDGRPVRAKFLSSLMYSHFGQLVRDLWQVAATPSQGLWYELGRVVQVALDALSDDVEPDIWERERRALLHDDWPAKALTRMNLAMSGDSEYRSVPNPLRARACSH